MSLFNLWLVFTFIPNFRGFLCIIGAALTGGLVMGALLVVLYFAATDINLLEKKNIRRLGGWGIFVLSLSLLINTVIPSESQMKYLIGGYVATSITEIEGSDKLPANVVGAVNSFLESLQDEDKFEDKK